MLAVLQVQNEKCSCAPQQPTSHYVCDERAVVDAAEQTLAGPFLDNRPSVI